MSRVGKRVLYKLHKSDAERINAMRELGQLVNPAKEGDVLPGVIVADWGGCVNLSVTLDGAVSPLWKTSVSEGTECLQWQLID